MFKRKLSLPPGLCLILFHFLKDVFQVNVIAYDCTKDTYYMPYVEVKRKKNGPSLAELRRSGFLDLRFHNRVILCINGPVVLYSDVERLEIEERLNSNQDESQDSLKSYLDGRNPSPGADEIDPKDEELRFKNGKLYVHEHKCIIINRLNPDLLKKLKEDQGRSNPELLGGTKVKGKLVLGVFLIGNKEGFNFPELAWFKGQNFDYLKTKSKTVKDSSFIMTGSNHSYCVRLPDGTHVKIGVEKSNSTGKNEVCRWTVKEEDKPWYAKVFQRGYDGDGIRNGEQTLEEGDYEFYDCPTDQQANIILLMSKTTPEPVTHQNYSEFDPFSLFNPNKWSPHGYRKDSNGLSGGDERLEDKILSVSCSTDPLNPNCVDFDMETSTITRDLQNVEEGGGATSFEIVLSDCIALPVFKRCEGRNHNGPRLLEIILELEPKYKPGEDAVEAEKQGNVDPMSPHYRNLNDNSTLAWKYDLLHLTAEIFSFLCVPFRIEMPYIIARVFAWYVYRAHLYGKTMGRTKQQNAPEEEVYYDLNFEFDKVSGKNDPWPILFKELERCRKVAKYENNGKGFKFQWEIGDESEKWKVPAVKGFKTRKRRENKIKRKLARKAYEQGIESKINYKMGQVEEEINAENILSRKKRDYKINGSKISTKYMQKGKTLTGVKSEGVWGFVREVIQEYKKKPVENDPRADAEKYLEYPENIQHCWSPQVDPFTRQVACSKTEELFFFEDGAELKYDLNIAIDLWWKIWATVIGYCNKAYYARKSETFPRLYEAASEYFFSLVKQEWTSAQDNIDLRIVLSEFLSAESQIWLDSCLEAAYVNSNSKSFRAPRPLIVVTRPGRGVANYFEEMPPNVFYRYRAEPNSNNVKK